MDFLAKQDSREFYGPKPEKMIKLKFRGMGITEIQELPESEALRRLANDGEFGISVERVE